MVRRLSGMIFSVPRMRCQVINSFQKLVSGKCLFHLTKGNQPIFLWKTRVSFSLPTMDARNTKVDFMFCYSNSVCLLAVAFDTLISLFLTMKISVLMILIFLGSVRGLKLQYMNKTINILSNLSSSANKLCNHLTNNHT